MLRRILASLALPMLLALVVGGCADGTGPTATLAPTIEPVTSPTQAPASAASLPPSPSPVPSEMASVPPASQRAPSPPAARRVVDAALAMIEAGSVHYGSEAHAEPPAADSPTFSTRGGASFAELRRFWVSIDANARIDLPTRDVMVDGEQAYLREGDSRYLPPGAWIVVEVPDDTLGWRSIVRTYGDPRLIIAPVLGVVTATPTGTEVVANAPADRFSVTIDPDRIRDALPAHLRDAWQRQEDDMPGAGPDSWKDPEVWIGSEGHVLRLRFVFETMNPDLPEVVVTYDFDRIGEPIDVAPGPGEEVLTMEEATERYEAFVASPSPSAP